MANHSSSPIVFGTRIALLTALLLASSCSREVPSTWTSDSPASAEAEAAPAQDVTLSLDGDPPLPGEAASGWLGLEGSSAAPDHSGHAGHGGHAAHADHAEQPAESEAPEPAPESSKPVTNTKQPKRPEPAPQPQSDAHADHDEHAGHAMPEGAHHHGH